MPKNQPPDNIMPSAVGQAKAAGFRQSYGEDTTPFPHGSLVKGTKVTVKASPMNVPLTGTPSSGNLYDEGNMTTSAPNPDHRSGTAQGTNTNPEVSTSEGDNY